MSCKWFVNIILALALALTGKAILWACPTCKQALSEQANAEGLVRGYYYSILFMMSMPFLILSGLVAYFYWEIRRARARQAIVSAPCVSTSSMEK